MPANAVLRFLLQDLEEQFQEVKAIVKRERCYVTLEVMAEVCYVLEGLYQVSREDIADNFRKLNFVDCLLYGYKMERGIDIVTFDKQLMKHLGNIENL